MSLCSYTLSKTKIPSFTLSGCKARYLLCILLIFSNYAERQGFEPRVPRGTTVFKTAAIDHSATSPELFVRVALFFKGDAKVRIILKSANIYRLF